MSHNDKAGARGSDLRPAVFSAGRWTATSSFARTIIQLVQTMVLARLLLPADFGIMAIVAAIVSVLTLVSDLGFSRALVHYDHVPAPVLSSLYWLNMIVAATLMLALAAASPLIANFYDEPRLTGLIVIMSLVFVLGAVGQQFRVLAEKRLRFAPLAVIELAAAIAGFLVAILVAVVGGGVYALAAGVLVTSATSSLGAVVWLSGGARPRFKLDFSETKPYLRFGGYQVGESLANTLHVQADTFIAGALLGPPAIGTYSLPRDLSLRIGSTINPIITRVGLPVMARLQHDRTALRSIYLRTLRMGASVSFPIYVAVILFAEEIVTVLYGSQWHEAVGYLRILAAWGLVRSTGNPVGSLIYAVGRPRLAFLWNIALLVIIPPLLWLGGGVGGLEGLAYSLLAIQVLIFVPLWRISVYPLCGARFKEYVAQFTTPLLIALASAILAYGAAHSIDGTLNRLLVGVGVGAVAYLGLSRIFNQAWFGAMVHLLKVFPVPSKTPAS